MRDVIFGNVVVPRFLCVCVVIVVVVVSEEHVETVGAFIINSGFGRDIFDLLSH